MKRLFSILCSTLFILASTSLTAADTKQTGTGLTIGQAVKIRENRKQDAQTIGNILFEPVLAGTPPQPNPYPTESINEKAVEETFGPQGLNADSTTLRHIKIFYFLLDFAAKLEKASRLATYGVQNSIDVATILESKASWQELVAQAEKKAGGTQALAKALDAIAKPNWNYVQGTLKAETNQDIITTPFWKSITVTTDDLVKSAVWQEFLKYSITKSFAKDYNFLDAILQAEYKIFKYIPNIEVSFYNEDFTILRYSSEFSRLSLVFTDLLRARFTEQSTELKQFVQPTTGLLDLAKTFSAAQEYKESNFYQLISLADQGLDVLGQQILQNNLKVSNNTYAQQPLVQEKLFGIAMIKNLEVRINKLFDLDNLEKSMKVLASTTITKPTPNLVFFKPEDHVMLEDLAEVLSHFNIKEKKENVQVQALGGGQVDDDTIVVQGIGEWITKAAKSTWKGFKKTASKVAKQAKKTWRDVETFGSDIGKGIEAGAESVLDDSLAVGMLVAGNKEEAQKLFKDASKLRKKVMDYMDKAYKDTMTIFNDSVKFAEDATEFGGELAGGVVAGLTGDTKLGKDFEGIINSATAAAIDWTANFVALPLEEAGGLLVMATEVVVGIADILTTAMEDVVQGKFSQLGSDVLDSTKYMLATVASTLLSEVSFVFGRFLEQFTEAIKMVGYLTAAITELLTDVSTLATKGLGAMGILSKEDAKDAETWIANHQRTINTVATTVVMIGAALATDGASIPLLAMTAVPQAYQGGSSFQADEKAITQKQEQKEYLKNFKAYVKNSEQVVAAAEADWEEELSGKFTGQVINQERQLGFYQNFLNTYFEGTKDQMSYYLGNYLTPQVEENKKNYDLRFADVGSIYGVRTGDGDQTGVLNLNPSQGFPLYNQQRDSFSQEIAVYPALAMQTAQDSSYTSTIPVKFWFNQKETMPLKKATQEVEILIKPIYVLNTFYLGLYFGGEPIDVNQIEKTGTANIDSGHLAKMLVFKKEKDTQKPQLALYEHEGQGWFKAPIQNAPVFDLGVWYRMKMNLNNNQLQLKIWKDGSPEPSYQTFTVKPTKQQTLGVISSGASVEYKLIKPTVKTTPVPVRQQSARNFSQEKSREQYARQTLDILMDPQVGAFNLKTPNKVQTLKGQYLYTTTKTNLVGKDNKPTNDYVILGNQYTQFKITEQGASPLLAVEDQNLKDYDGARVISLISGGVFDPQGQPTANSTDALESFLAQHGPLTDELQKELQTTHKAYQQTRMGPFKFGTIELRIASKSDMQNGIFVYTGTSPAPEITDKKGNPIKDAQGKPVFDYFVMAQKEDGTGSGAEYTPAMGYLRSLVSGYMYDKKSIKPLNTNAPFSNGSGALSGTPSTQLTTAIDNAVKIFNKNLAAEIAARKPMKLIPAHKTKQDDMSSKTGGYSSTVTTTAQPLSGKTPDKSVEQRSQEASGGQTTIGQGFGQGF